MAEVVIVDKLTKEFKTIKAVNNLSFAVNGGDIYGFLGQNGAGKSTTMRMLLSLIKPTSGTIRIFNKNLDWNRKYILQNTGAMIERPDLYKYLSAIDNLKIIAKLSGADFSKSHLIKHLSIVGLEKRAADKVGSYSQGMKQRLGIAIALVHNPLLVILDEPTNGLDPQGIVDIRNLIIQLSQDQKKTIIVSSHLLNEIEQIATRILIVDKGQKVTEGTTQELINPEDTLVRIQTGDTEKAFQVLNNSSFQVLNRNKENVIEISIAKKDIPLLTKYLVENSIDIYSIQQLNNLERYFLRLTAN